MNAITKTLAGTIAAGAMVASSASPALARDQRGDGVSAGDVIAGAVVLGGIAAIAASASNHDRDYGYTRAGYGDYGAGYGGDYGHDRGFGQRDGRWNGGSRRGAVEQCIAAAERDASRYGYGRADVTDIRGVRETRWGFEVKGRIAVNTMGRAWHNGDARYGQGWGGDYRGWNDGLRGYDAGQFSCRVERGRVVGVNFKGLRGL